MDLNASQAGITVLKHGGNAIDAAVATASALGVTIPFVAGPGGGGFMVIYLAETDQVVTIDGRENCPAACTPTMFTGHGQPLGYDYASDQPLATGVPSMVATWATARKDGALTTPRPEGRGFQPSPAGFPVPQATAPGRTRNVLRHLRRQTRQDLPPGRSSRR